MVYAMLLLQQITMNAMEIRAGLTPPKDFTVEPIWDETLERLPFNVDKIGTIKAKVESFVLIMACQIVWKEGDEPEVLHLLIPPIPLSTTSADSIWNGMRCHAMSRPVWRFILRMMELSTYKFAFPCTDAASGNRKVHCYMLQVPSLSFWLIFVMLCMNHQNWVGHMDMVLAIFGKKLLGSLYHVSRFHNIGCNRLRCIEGTRLRFDPAKFVIKAGKQNTTWKSCAAELVGLLRKFEKHNEEDQAGTRRRKTTPSQRPSDLVERYCGIVICDYHDSDIIIETTKPDTPDVRFAFHEELVEIQLKLNLVQAQEPSTGKWTKTNLCCHQQLGKQLNNNQKEVFTLALGKISFKVQTEEHDFDQEDFLHYNKCASKSQNQALGYLSCADDRAFTVILTICDEHFVTSTKWLMKVSATSPEFDADKSSPFERWACDRRGPPYRAQCNCSHLMSGRSTRIRILLMFRGFCVCIYI